MKEPRTRQTEFLDERTTERTNDLVDAKGFFRAGMRTKEGVAINEYQRDVGGI